MTRLAKFIAKSLEGKYLKDCQCLYHIIESDEDTVYGIEINPCLETPINKDWSTDIEAIDLSSILLTKEEFIKELEKSITEIKEKIIDEFISK